MATAMEDESRQRGYPSNEAEQSAYKIGGYTNGRTVNNVAYPAAAGVAGYGATNGQNIPSSTNF